MKLCTLLAGLLLAIFTRAQTYDVSQWLITKNVDGKDIQMLRVPDTQFGSKLLGFISDAQHQLGRLPGYYRVPGKYAFEDLYKDIERDCQNIEKADPNFPVKYYREEIKQYEELKVEMEQKEAAKKKAQEEADFFARLKADFAWVSSDTLQVRTKPDAKAPSIGKLLRLSYIHAYDVEDNEDWVQIDFGEHSGYVLREDIAIDWEELNPSQEDSAKLDNGRYFHFTPTAAYTAQLKKAAAEEEREMRAANAAPRRRYIKGPKGGCYYINSHGNKQYVDRSFCN